MQMPTRDKSSPDPTPRKRSWLLPLIIAAILVLGAIAISNGYISSPFVYKNL
jgi:hypothetical protein